MNNVELLELQIGVIEITRGNNRTNGSSVFVMPSAVCNLGQICDRKSNDIFSS